MLRSHWFIRTGNGSGGHCGNTDNKQVVARNSRTVERWWLHPPNYFRFAVCAWFRVTAACSIGVNVSTMFKWFSDKQGCLNVSTCLDSLQGHHTKKYTLDGLKGVTDKIIRTWSVVNYSLKSYSLISDLMKVQNQKVQPEGCRRRMMAFKNEVPHNKLNKSM